MEAGVLKTIDSTAWSSGQVSSKLWLCEELERVLGESPATVWIYGAWYGLAAFLLLARDRARVTEIALFDIDPAAYEGSLIFNRNWMIFGDKVKSFVRDCNDIEPRKDRFGAGEPNVFINTSCEHVPGRRWFERIPEGRLVALQTSTHDFPEHHCRMSSAEEFARSFPLRKIHFRGEKIFDYGGGNSFRRFMLIGEK